MYLFLLLLINSLPSSIQIKIFIYTQFYIYDIVIFHRNLNFQILFYNFFSIYKIPHIKCPQGSKKKTKAFCIR